MTLKKKWQVWTVFVFLAVAMTWPQMILCAEKSVRVGVYENSPKVFIDEKGRPGGLWVVILDDMAAKENWNLIYVPGNWQQCLDRLESGEIDLMMDIAYSSEREARFDFNQVKVLSNWTVVYVHENQDITEIGDLENKTIAAMQGGIETKIFKQFDIPCTFVETLSYEEAFLAVDQGRAAAALISQFYGITHEDLHKVKRTSIVFSPLKLHFAATKGRHLDLLAAIDTHLQSMKADKVSIYHQELKKLLGGEEKEILPTWILYCLLLGSFLLLSILVFTLLLKRQVQAQTRELKSREERYRLHFENVSDVIYSLDQEFRVVDISPSVERLFGYTAEELAGKPFPDLNLLAPEDMDRAVSDTLKLLSGEKVPPTVYSFVKKDGQRILAEINSNVILKNGMVEGIVSVGRDVTDREQMSILTKELTSVLQIEQNKLSAAFENMDFGVVICDGKAGNI
ncbi:MAG: transporter substrate-binding domain-containing protein, partial [Proteobacteria bacterium]|nr:transporter substrate-binding domain-containing protein [Pseudomonadota bacterium]